MSSSEIVSIVKNIMKTMNDGILINQTEDKKLNKFANRGIQAQLDELSKNSKENVRKRLLQIYS